MPVSSKRYLGNCYLRGNQNLFIMPTEYKRIIENLIMIKDELKVIEDKKLHSLISVLQQYEISPDEELPDVPDKNDIADKLKISHSKINLLIQKLYSKILLYYADHPLEITECEQSIYIHLPKNEDGDFEYDPEWDAQHSFYMKVKLPVIPRIGEEISLCIVEHRTRLDRGYVHDVEHTILGKKQFISIFVHPTKDYYFKWKKMQKNYEEHQRWLKRINSK